VIVLHPRWVERAGVGDIVRHFQTRGFDVSNVVGSRFFHLEPPPARPPPSELDNILAIFRGTRR
jgi:nucleoside diphosphate kinase